MQVENRKEGVGAKFARRLKKNEYKWVDGERMSAAQRIEGLAGDYQQMGRDLGAANVEVYKQAATDYHGARGRVNQLRSDMPFYDVGVPALRQVIQARGTDGYSAAVESAQDKFGENPDWQNGAGRHDLMLRAQGFAAHAAPLTMGSIRELQNEGRTKKARLSKHERSMDEAGGALDLMGAQMDAFERPSRTEREQRDAAIVREAHNEHSMRRAGRQREFYAPDAERVAEGYRPQEYHGDSYDFIETGAREDNDEVPLEENVAGVPAVGGFTPYANAQLIPLLNRIG